MAICVVRAGVPGTSVQGEVAWIPVEKGAGVDFRLRSPGEITP